MDMWLPFEAPKAMSYACPSAHSLLRSGADSGRFSPTVCPTTVTRSRRAPSGETRVRERRRPKRLPNSYLPNPVKSHEVDVNGYCICIGISARRKGERQEGAAHVLVRYSADGRQWLGRSQYLPERHSISICADGREVSTASHKVMATKWYQTSSRNAPFACPARSRRSSCDAARSAAIRAGLSRVKRGPLVGDSVVCWRRKTVLSVRGRRSNARQLRGGTHELASASNRLSRTVTVQHSGRMMGRLGDK